MNLLHCTTTSRTLPVPARKYFTSLDWPSPFLRWIKRAVVGSSLVLPVFNPGAQAADIVNETFTGRTSPGLSDGSAPYRIPFFTNNGSASLSMRSDVVSFLDDYRLRLVTYGGNRPMIGTLYSSAAAASSVTLGSEIGSKLELTFDFAFANENGSGSGGNDWLSTSNGDTVLNFGLFNSNGTATTANGQTTSHNDFGYFGRVGVKGTAVAGLYKESGVNSSLCTGTDVTALPAGTLPFMPGVTTNRVRYSVNYIIERVTSTSVRSRFIVLQDGTTIASAGSVDASGAYTSFNEVVIGLGAGANRHELQVDNVALRTYAPPAKLTWAPPVLTNPITKTVAIDQSFSLQTAGADYIIKIQNRLGAAGGLSINCGNARNVVMIGGEIDIPYTGPYAETTGKRRRGLQIVNWTGTCHIEGLWIHGADLGEGIDIDARAPGATLQMQNVRIDNVHSRPEEIAAGWSNTHHPDILQNWGGPAYYRIDRLTGYSDYQGMMIQPKQFGEYPVNMADFRNMDLHYLNPTNGGRYMIYYTSGVTAWNFENVWVQPRPGNEWTGGVYPNNSPLFVELNRGNPSGGNMAPVSVPGMFYMSPGYLP